MTDDWTRDQALRAVSEFLAENSTNAIGADFVWRAVNTALETFENELFLHEDTQVGYAVMQGCQPIIVLPTRKLAKMHARLLKRHTGKPMRIAKCDYVGVSSKF